MGRKDIDIIIRLILPKLSIFGFLLRTQIIEKATEMVAHEVATKNN